MARRDPQFLTQLSLCSVEQRFAGMLSAFDDLDGEAGGPRTRLPGEEQAVSRLRPRSRKIAA